MTVSGLVSSLIESDWFNWFLTFGKYPLKLDLFILFSLPKYFHIIKQFPLLSRFIIWLDLIFIFKLCISKQKGWKKFVVCWQVQIQFDDFIHFLEKVIPPPAVITESHVVQFTLYCYSLPYVKVSPCIIHVHSELTVNQLSGQHWPLSTCAGPGTWHHGYVYTAQWEFGQPTFSLAYLVDKTKVKVD